MNLDKNHVECSLSDTDIEIGVFENIYPVTNLEDGGSIEFMLENNSVQFLDLANSFLKLKCKITKANGTNIVAEDVVTMINYPIASLYSQVDILLGGKVISSSTNNYAFRAYLETLLNYGEDAKKTQLGMGLFYQDTPGQLNVLDPEGENSGLNERNEYGRLSRTVCLQGRIHSDIFNQGRLLINGVPLRITLHRQKNHFVLLSANQNADYKVKIIDIAFCLRKVQLTPHKFEEIQKRLEKGPALYHLNRVDIKTHSIAAGLTSLNWDNAILGQLPTRVFIGMIDNTAFTGSFTENPFNFQHNNISSIAVFMNGKSVPGNPLKMDFTSGDFLEGYNSLFLTAGKLNRDEGGTIARKDYARGFTLFGFDLTPTLCHGEHQDFKQNGNLRILLEFKEALPRSTTVIVYAEFENTLSVYKSRQVLKDY